MCLLLWDYSLQFYVAAGCMHKRYALYLKRHNISLTPILFEVLSKTKHLFAHEGRNVYLVLNFSLVLWD